MGKSSKGAASFVERKRAAVYARIDVWQTRVAGLLVILLLCVHPLYFNWERYYNLTRNKYVFFLICMSAVLLFVIAIWIARMTRSPRLLPQDKLCIADWAVLGYAAVTIVSALFSPYRGIADVWGGIAERHDGAISQLLYVAVYFIVSRWYRPNTRDLVIFGISAILVALIGIFQFYGMDFFGLWPMDDPNYTADNYFNILFRSTLGNTNIVSTYVCVAVLLSGFLFIRGKSKWGPLWLAASALNFWLMDLANADSGKVGLFAAMLLSIPFIIETRKTLGKALILASSWLVVYTLQRLFFQVITLGTRAPISLIPYTIAAVALAGIGTALMLLKKWDKERDPEAPPRWKLGVILIAACIILGIAGVEVLGRQDPESGNTNFIFEVREILHGNIRDEFGTNRVYIWRNALTVFPENPVIGSGPDTFYNTFPEEAQGKYNRERYHNAHNEYLQILICQGIIGLLCYLVFLGGVLVKAIPPAFKNPLVAAALIAFVGYCAQAFFNLSLPIASQMLWVCAGLLASKRVREALPELEL